MLKPATPSTVIETQKFQEVYERLTSLSKTAMALIDVDNTIITPKAAMFRASTLIDDIKANKYPFLDTEKIISEWRLQRKVILVDAGWPALLKQMHILAIPSFALTHMVTGKYGAIDNIERWRYKELKSLDVVFTDEFLNHSEMVLMPHSNQTCGGALFYKGIFLTGDYNKELVLPKILELFKPSEVVVVDDLQTNIFGLQKICLEKGVPYTGILFRGVDLLPNFSNNKIAEIQKQTLLKSGRWLEDDEAENETPA